MEKQDKEERIEKARVEMQMKEKVEAEKRRREDMKEKAVNEEKRFKKAQMIEEAYRKTTKSIHPKQSIKPVREDSGSEEEDSMDLSQLENIKQQINKLDNIIQTSSKKKQWSSHFPINWKVFEKLDYIATMVAGNIQERIKKMKEAILMEAKQRAHFTVETAS